jgi:hypothetical protein
MPGEQLEKHKNEHEHGHHEHEHGHHDDVVTLEVATPKGPWKGRFPSTTLVSEVIKTIVKDLKLADEPYQLVHEKRPLEPTSKPLSSFGLTGTVKLALVATGSGV